MERFGVGGFSPEQAKLKLSVPDTYSNIGGYMKNSTVINKVKIFISLTLIVIYTSLFIYPAVVISWSMVDSRLYKEGESRFLPLWFETTTDKFNNWADDYLKSESRNDTLAKQEWTPFGALFYLQSVESLMHKKRIDVNDPDTRRAVDNAVAILLSPKTSAPYEKIWKKHRLQTGKSHLESENIFFRMLYLMGLASYREITGESRYDALIARQSRMLYDELFSAKYHLGDDYPGQCYPNDVLWSVAAIVMANGVSDHPFDTNELVNRFMGVMDGELRDGNGLPAFQADSKHGRIIQTARGSSTSGVLLYAAYLEPGIAQKWYDLYERHFLRESTLFTGVSEFPEGTPGFMDIDTGLVVNGYGSVATLFGIGASTVMGRYDHSIPMTMEMVALAWPTPYGFLLPSLAGKSVVESWALGDVAMLYTLSRERVAPDVRSYRGSIPLIVWILAALHWTLGVWFVRRELIWIRRSIRSTQGDSNGTL